MYCTLIITANLLYNNKYASKVEVEIVNPFGFHNVVYFRVKWDI